MDKVEASGEVEQVLNKVISELDGWEEGDMLVDWIVIAYTSNPDSEKQDAYPMLFANGDMATYRARGLLTTGMLYLDAIPLESEDEDDNDD